MSSLKSVTDAIISVAERSFFAYAEPVPAGDEVAMPGDCYEMSVAFAGPFAGVVSLVMPVALAHELCLSFSGLGPDEPLADGAVSDLAGEFANMACGTWLTSLEQAVCFSLAHPVVGRAGAVVPEQGAVVRINEQPVGVRLELVS